MPPSGGITTDDTALLSQFLSIFVHAVFTHPCYGFVHHLTGHYLHATTTKTTISMPPEAEALLSHGLMHTAAAPGRYHLPETFAPFTRRYLE